MFTIGGNTFDNCGLPLVFAGNYFIVESADSKILVTVVTERDGHYEALIVRNEPVSSPLFTVTKTAVGIITVADKKTGKFLYKIRPASDTSIVFGTLNEVEVKISDRRIMIGTNVFEQNVLSGLQVGFTVLEGGGFTIGGSVPSPLRKWLGQESG